MQRGEFDVGQLTLAVGQGLRHAIQIHLHAPEPEVRPAAGTPDREPLVERVVPAIGDEDTGHCRERFVQSDGGLASGQLVSGDDGGSHRERRERVPPPRHRHFKIGEPHQPGRVAKRVLRLQRNQHEKRGDHGFNLLEFPHL